MKVGHQTRQPRPKRRRRNRCAPSPITRRPPRLVIAGSLGLCLLGQACSSSIHSDRVATGMIAARQYEQEVAAGCRAPTGAIEAALSIVAVDPTVPCSVQRRMGAGLGLALSALQRHAECRTLFAGLDADGHEVLARTRFRIASPRQERTFCRRCGAFTTVGGRVTVLCRNFAYLSDEESAVMLLHEALHHAGQREYPQERLAPTSFEITQMVARSCGFAGGD